jgi:hypothetical protein
VEIFVAIDKMQHIYAEAIMAHDKLFVDRSYFGRLLSTMFMTN